MTAERDTSSDAVGSKSVFMLDRRPPSEEVQKRHSSQFADHVTTELRSCLTGLPEGGELKPASPRRGTSGADADTLLERYGFEVHRPARTFELTVREGCRIQGTPYDLDWSVGTGFGFLARFDGTVITVSSEGFSAAALGFYLSSSQAATVAVTPSGQYEYSLLAVKDTPGLISQGGLGVTVYYENGTSPAPAYSRRIWLWDERGDLRKGKLLGGVTGNGQIASASSAGPPGGFGPVPLAPILLTLDPDERVLLWVWNWQATVNHDGFVAFLTMAMPAVTVCAGPPIIVR